MPRLNIERVSFQDVQRSLICKWKEKPRVRESMEKECLISDRFSASTRPTSQHRHPFRNPRSASTHFYSSYSTNMSDNMSKAPSSSSFMTTEINKDYLISLIAVLQVRGGYGKEIKQIEEGYLKHNWTMGEVAFDVALYKRVILPLLDRVGRDFIQCEEKIQRMREEIKGMKKDSKMHGLVMNVTSNPGMLQNQSLFANHTGPDDLRPLYIPPPSSLSMPSLDNFPTWSPPNSCKPSLIEFLTRSTPDSHKPSFIDFLTLGLPDSRKEVLTNFFKQNLSDSRKPSLTKVPKRSPHNSRKSLSTKALTQNLPNNPSAPPLSKKSNIPTPAPAVNSSAPKSYTIRFFTTTKSPESVITTQSIFLEGSNIGPTLEFSSGKPVPSKISTDTPVNSKLADKADPYSELGGTLPKLQGNASKAPRGLTISGAYNNSIEVGLYKAFCTFYPGMGDRVDDNDWHFTITFIRVILGQQLAIEEGCVGRKAQYDYKGYFLGMRPEMERQGC
ncbi:hypothetical protein K504DRAFT_507074 [Pleomassaria siparia CBS 279.74]|uniref:Uncharacterized protein n=1 Tax=Pleomassaria siparia CBS 279.74 TaxID=1314801 RepID=A0A6G1JWK7_9PLEO|nr:hypothetical protein K504DRAFT_507074 [Pleomassaria siparia CBS 279.74]